MATIPNGPRPGQFGPRPTDTADALEVQQAILRELVAIRKLFDEFAAVFLNARFYGTGTDRWSRRR